MLTVVTTAYDCLHEWGAEAICMTSEVTRLPPPRSMGMLTLGPRPHGEAACRYLVDSPPQQSTSTDSQESEPSGSSPLLQTEWRRHTLFLWSPAQTTDV